MTYENLINDSFININTTRSLSPINNKHVLSVVNDYEDGEWRYTKFQNYIWDNIAETSLSQNERMSLVNQSHTLLTSAAKNLRLTDKDDDIRSLSHIS